MIACYIMSVIEMKKRFKVWVYKEGDRPLFHSGRWSTYTPLKDSSSTSWSVEIDLFQPAAPMRPSSSSSPLVWKELLPLHSSCDLWTRSVAKCRYRLYWYYIKQLSTHTGIKAVELTIFLWLAMTGYDILTSLFISISNCSWIISKPSFCVID